MKNKIEIKSIWEDESLLEVKISASNNLFSGSANCYTNRGKIEELANLLNCFPRNLNEVVNFTTGDMDNISFFSLFFKTIDGSGHISVRVKVAHIQTYTNTEQENYVSEFDIFVEPAAIDIFSSKLKALSTSSIGDITATLNGKT